MTKKIIVQVPDEIIRNKYCEIDSKTFATYAYLKFLHFRNTNEDKNIITLDHQKLKHKLYISDNRTLKKIFKTLHQYNFIYEYIDKFPTKGALTFTFNPIPFESKKFTQLPVTVFNRIDNIGVVGLHLLFYYESYINRTDLLVKQFAFPSIETISHDIKADKETVKKYNDLLIKNKVIKIDKHEIHFTGEYNELDTPIFKKYSNHYYVKLEKL